MLCEEALELISAALDGELSPSERNALDAHLADCPDCAALFDELAGQSRLLRELDCEMPADLAERILSQLSDRQTGPAPSRPVRAFHWRRWGALAACLALAVWAGLSLPGISGSSAPESSIAAYTLDDSVSSGEAASACPEPAPSGWNAKSAGDDQLSAQAMPGSVQYLRTTWTDGTGALTAQYLGTYADLTDYLAQYEDDLAVVSECYDEVYFETAALIAVPLEEASGSVLLTVSEVEETADGYAVIIRRETPDASTDDMSSWLILIETEPASSRMHSDAADAVSEDDLETDQEEVIYVLVEDEYG